MRVKIKFENPNVDAQSILVYRSETPIDKSALPAVHATLAGNVTEYVDDYVEYKKVYYYAFDVIKGSDHVLGNYVKAVAVNYTGAGPQELIAGDTDAGYYGSIVPTDFISWTDLAKLLNLTGMTLTTYPAAAQLWLKFSHKGKTLFTPQKPICTGPWEQLYKQGLIYGTKGAHPRTFTTIPEVEQYRTVEINKSKYLVRSMTALPPGVNPAVVQSVTVIPSSPIVGQTIIYRPGFYDSVNDLTGSEWNDLMLKMFTVTPPSQRGENFAQMNMNLSYDGSNTAGMLCTLLFQERNSAGNVWSRCTMPGNSNGGSIAPAYIANLSTGSNGHWRPVLELIE